MEKLLTSFDTSKRLTQILEPTLTEFGWFGDENHIVEEGKRWLWCANINPVNNQELDNRIDLGCLTAIYPAYTIVEMMDFFAKGKNGEHLNEAIRSKLNSGNKLSSFIADPEFYANLIFDISLTPQQ